MDDRIPLLIYDDSSDSPEPVEAAPIPTAAAASSAQAAATDTDTEAVSKPAKVKGILKGTPQSTGGPCIKPSKSQISDGLSDQQRSNALQELGRERKRRAFMGMLKLLEHGAKDAQQLHALVAPMSDEELLQVAEERALAGKCGNPLCSKPFSWQEPRNKFLVSADNIRKVEGDSYCSKACSSFVQQLAVQLVNPMSRIKPAAFEQYMARPSHRPKQGVAAQGGGVETMKSVIEERAPCQLIHEAEAAGQQLDASAAASSGDSTAAAAVEGYVPRSTPAKQPQQQQQVAVQQEATEVLQLQPVLQKAPKPVRLSAAELAPTAASNVADRDLSTRIPALASAANEDAPASGRGDDSAAATGASTSTAALTSTAVTANATTSLESMLKVFKQLQNKQLQQMNTQQDDAEDMTAAGQQAAAAAAGMQRPSSSQSSSSQSSSSQSSSVFEVSVSGVEQLPERCRTVTFAPSVEYSCPAEAQPPPEQPVLTFTMHDAGSPLDLGNATNGSSSGGELIGELQLTGAEALHPHLAAAGDSEADSDSDSHTDGGEESACASTADVDHFQLPAMPDAWKLFLPPALGGVGVPVKQLVKTRPVTTQQQHRGRNTSRNMHVPAPAPGNRGAESATKQQQQQRRPPQQPTVGTSMGPIHSDASNSSRLPGGPTPQSTSFKVQSAMQSKLAASNRQQAQQQGAHSNSSSNAAVGSSAVAGNAAVPRPRKFTPVVRPRRSLIILEESDVPGVTVKQRGVRASGNAAGKHSSQQLQQQQQVVGQQLKQPARQHEGNIGQLPAVTTAGAQAAAAPARSGTAVRSAVNGSTAIIADSSSCDDSGNEADTLYDPGSEHSDEEQWCHEPVYAGDSSSRSSGNRSGQQQQQRRKTASNSSEDDSEGDADGLDTVGRNESDFADDEPWSDKEGLSLGDLGLSSDILGRQGTAALESILPFLDTKGVTVHLSEFGFIWNTVHEWISPATVAYVSNMEQHLQEPALLTSITEHACTGAVASAAAGPACDASDDVDQQQQKQVVPSLAVVQQRQAMATMLGHALPLVAAQLGVTVPVSELNKHLNALVRSFHMSRPLPSLQMQQWQLIVGLMLAALSAWRLPVLRPMFAKHQQPGSRLEVLITSLGSDVDKFMALLDLFELDS